MPYSGPASALSAVGKVQTRYFQMINERGGINGRKIKLISLDDGYSPPKAVEQTRRLVENDEAVAIFGSMGTAQNAAVQKYLNGRKVPQLFVFAASDRFADPKTSPYTISGMTLFSTEAAIYARLVSETIPRARVAVLYQNDDYGREYLRSFKGELARLDPQAEIAAAAPYEVTSPTVDSQVVSLASTRADVFLNASTGKFTSQAIRKASELGWRAQQFLPIGSNFVATILKPAGLENAKGAISATPDKDRRRSRMGPRSCLSRVVGLHEEVLSGRRHRGSAQLHRMERRRSHDQGDRGLRQRPYAAEPDEACNGTQGRVASGSDSRHHCELRPRKITA